MCLQSFSWAALVTAWTLLSAQALPAVTGRAQLPIAAGTVRTEFGIQINGCDRDPVAYLGDIRQLGFTWIKQQVRWGDMTSPRGTDWRCLDRLMAATRRHPIKVLLSVTTAPAHLRLARNTLGFPDRLEDFGLFLHALLTRYPKQVQALEVWNEPNIDAESSDGVSALRYQAYLTMGHGIAKAVAPNILVISAAPAPITHADGVKAIDDKRFLDKLFEYDGLARLDCIGAHANGPSPDGDIDSVVTRYATLAERSRPVCVTEFGYALPVNGRTPPDFAWAMRHTAAGQTRTLTQGAALGAAIRSRATRDPVELELLLRGSTRHKRALCPEPPRLAQPGTDRAARRIGFRQSLTAIAGTAA